MKTYFLLLFLMVCGCLGLQIWFYLAYLVEERTRPFHERGEIADH